MTTVQVEPSAYGLGGWGVRVVVPAKARPRINDQFTENPDVTINIGATTEVVPGEVLLESGDAIVGAGWTVPVASSQVSSHIENFPVVVLKSRVGARAKVTTDAVCLSSSPVSIRIPCNATVERSKVALNATGHSLMTHMRRAKFYRRRTMTRPLAEGEVVANVL